MSPIVTSTLEDAIKSWEKMVQVNHSMFQMPVETVPPSDKKSGHRNLSNLWLFATDNKKVLAHIYQPEEVDQLFEDIVQDMYQDAYGKQSKSQGLLQSVFGSKTQDEEFRKALSYHNAFSLLIHELFHPLYCPNAKEDKEKIYQAISDGIKEALPQTSAADLVVKTRNVENAVWDFCIDTFQYHFLSQNRGLAPEVAEELKLSGYKIDGKEVGQFPEGVIPIFDVVSYAKEKKVPQSVLTFNRYTYSLLFCADLETRKKLLDYFQKKIVAGGVSNLEQLVKESLKGLVEEVNPALLRDWKINPQKFQAAVDKFYADKESADYDNKYVIGTMASLLMEKSTRYDAIRGFIKPLAHLIDVKNYEQRGMVIGVGGQGQGQGQGSPSQGQSGSGSPGQNQSQGGGSSGQNGPKDLSEVLQAILDGMSESEASQFLQALANGTGMSPGNPHGQQLMMLGRDDYYKRNSPEISLESQGGETVNFSQGKMKKWVKDRSLRVPIQELHRYQKWINFGQEQKLPVLLELVSGQMYLVNFFHEEETDLKSFRFEEKKLDLPANWVLLNDSSGSMGEGTVGCGSRWDALEHINYGLLKTLYKASGKTSKPVQVWVVNFSDRTQLAGPVELRKFYEESSSQEKKALLLDQGGGTTLNTNVFSMIEKKLRPGRTVWSFATDGEISNYSDVYSNLERLVKRPDQCVLYFEMFSSGLLGSQLKGLQKSRPNLQYHSVSDLRQILDKSLNVLIKY